MAQKGMDDYPAVLSANQERSFDVPGDFFHVVSAEGAIGLRFDEGKRITRYEGMGGRVYYSRVAVFSPIAQTVVMSFGYGYATDARATANVNVNATTEPANLTPQAPTVTVPAGGSIKLADADSSRKELRLSILSDATGYILLGDADVETDAGDGGSLEPGQVDYIATEGELWAYNPGADDIAVYVLPLRRA